MFLAHFFGQVAGDSTIMDSCVLSLDSWRLRELILRLLAVTSLAGVILCGRGEVLPWQKGSGVIITRGQAFKKICWLTWAASIWSN